MKKVFFKTFGCRSNIFDTQVMIAKLGAHELATSESDANTIVINSCTVTNGADSGVRQYANKMHRAGKQLYFTGCGTDTIGQQLFDSGKLTGLFFSSEKERIAEHLEYTQPYADPTHRENYIEETVIEELKGKSRAFVKIQEGCDFSCSFCIIPHARGQARSKPESQIITQIEKLAERGYSEFILTGTNVGSYGKDTGTSLATLLPKLGSISGVRRIRLGSLEPSQIDTGLIELLSESYMAKHLHIALQHTSDRMLSIMNRQNRYATDHRLLESIAKQGLAIGTDYIVGHPGESDEIFQEAFANLASLPLTHIHCFTYSEREGTPSASMEEKIPGNLAKERFWQISNLISQKNAAFKSTLTAPLEVLVESQDTNRAVGLDQYYNHVIIVSEKSLSQTWVTLKEYELCDEKITANLE